MRRIAWPAFSRLIRAFKSENVFNPWIDTNIDDDRIKNGPSARLERLRHHLDKKVRYILIGEASGYQGCRMTGMAFTSERLLLAGNIPRITVTNGRLSTRPRPWSEPSATVVWATLHALGIAERCALWNAFAWHPHRPSEPLSNRTPTPNECQLGLEVLEALLQQFPRARLFAVGRQAERALSGVGRNATPLRHPSMGGAKKFRRDLETALS